MQFGGSRSNCGYFPPSAGRFRVLGMVLGVRVAWGSHLVSGGPRGQQALGQVVLQVTGTGVGPPGQQQPDQGLLAGGPGQCCCHVQGGVPVGLRDVRGLRGSTNHPSAPHEVPQRPLGSDTDSSSPQWPFDPSEPPRTPSRPTMGTLNSSTDPSNQPTEIPQPQVPHKPPHRAPQSCPQPHKSLQPSC